MEETLNPSFSSPLRVGTLRSSVFNLVSTIIGGGILSVPYAIQQAGLGLGLILMTFTAIATDYSIYILISCSRRSGIESYDGIVQNSFGPRWKILTMILVILLTFLAMIAYTILIRDLGSSLVEAYLVSYSLSTFERNIVSTIMMGLVVPSCFLPSLAALQTLSMSCVFTAIVLAISVCYRAFDCLSNDKGNQGWSRAFQNMPWFSSSSFNILEALPIFICTFVCHFNVLPVHAELSRPTRDKVHKMVHYTIFLSYCLYTFIGVAGLLQAACHDTSVDPNLLNDYGDTDILMNIGRFGLSIALMSSFPLLLVPCRNFTIRLASTLNKLYFTNKNSIISQPIITPSRIQKTIEPISLSDVDVTSHSESSSSSSWSAPISSTRYSNSDLSASHSPDHHHHHHQEEEEEVVIPTSPKSYSITITYFVLNVLIAYGISNVAIVWGLLGSTVSIIISFMIPFWAYLRIRPNIANNTAANSDGFHQINQDDDDDEVEVDIKQEFIGKSEYHSQSDEVQLRSSNWSRTMMMLFGEDSVASGRRLLIRRVLCRILLVVFVIIGILCTGNVIYSMSKG